MGWRFRKTVGFGRLVRLNFSGRGVSLGLGPRGASVTLNKRGVRQTFSVPGTGFSHSTFSKWGGRSPPTQAVPPQQLEARPPAEIKGRWRTPLIAFGLLGVGLWGVWSPDKGTVTPPATAPVAAVPSTPLVDSLLRPAAANRALTPDEVREAQALLKALGFDAGAADGIVGPMTIAAAKRYTTVRGLASGELDLRLLDSLRASQAGARK